MRCPECGLEMLIYQVSVDASGVPEVEYVCRNPRCGRFDRRLLRPADGKTERDDTPTA